MISDVIYPKLVEEIVSQFHLDLLSVHGPAHWMRVRKNGLLLAEFTGANTKVIELFSLFHDSCRFDDWSDPDHGPRAADLADYYFHEMKMLNCNEDELHLLKAACESHTYGDYTDDPTIGTCWDADRLDLPRVGITVDPNRLCTIAARTPKIIADAETRAESWLHRVKWR